MKITFLVIGKTDEKYLNEGINGYLDRLKHYCKPEFKIIPDKIDVLIIDEPP